MISKERLDEFKKIYKKQFGKEIKDEDAREQAEKLLRLVGIVYKPITKEEYEKYKTGRERT